MEQQGNTIWLKAYTPGGFQVGITVAFTDGKLPLAVDVEALVTGAGYLLTLPGAVAGAEIETITHVMKRLQFNQRDNSTTPCIGFYHENKGLVYCYWNHYLNTPEDVAAFEAVAGIKVDAMPLLEDSAFPKRDDHFKQKYLVALQRPLQIQVIKEQYTKEDGAKGTRVKSFEGFYEVLKPAAVQSPSPASGNAGSGSPDALENQLAPNEVIWKQWVFNGSTFLYTHHGEYNQFEHKASLQKRQADTGNLGINPSMTLYETLNQLIRYRALHDMFIDSGDYQSIFGSTLDEYVDKFSHVQAWERINDWYAAQTNTPAAQPKKAS